MPERMEEKELFAELDKRLAEIFPLLFGSADDVNKRLDEVSAEIEKDKNIIDGKFVEK